MVLEVLFHIKKHPKIKGIEICEDSFLFFSKITNSLKTCLIFFFGTETKSDKVWNSWNRSPLKGVQVAVFGMRYIGLCNKAIKIFDSYFSYNSSRIKKECNYLKIISNVQSLLNSGNFEFSLLKDKLISLKV